MGYPAAIGQSRDRGRDRDAAASEEGAERAREFFARAATTRSASRSATCCFCGERARAVARARSPRQARESYATSLGSPDAAGTQINARSASANAPPTA